MFELLGYVILGRDPFVIRLLLGIIIIGLGIHYDEFNGLMT